MRVPGVLEIVAQDSLPGVNQARKLRVVAPVLLGAAVAIVGPAIFGIETVGQQDDRPVIDRVRMLRRRIQNLAMMEM